MFYKYSIGRRIGGIGNHEKDNFNNNSTQVKHCAITVVVLSLIAIVLTIVLFTCGVFYVGKKVADDGLKGVIIKVWYGTNVNEASTNAYEKENTYR